MSAVLGAFLWLAAPLSFASSPWFGSVEHVFLFMPLVAAPLAIVLLCVLVDPEGESKPRTHRVGQCTQPVAAVMVLASFLVPKGALAGCLTLGWLAMALVMAVGGLRRLKRQAGAHLPDVSLLAAHLFLPVGAGWLFLSRSGVGPRNLAPLTVLLAALHFHFSGFTLQILIAATGRHLQAVASRLAPVHRCVAIVAIVGIPLIAAGNLLSSPILKFLGVACMVLGTSGLAATSAALGLEVRARTPRFLLLGSAASIAAGMLVAGIYGVGELAGTGSIGIPRMVTMHGLLNALGFTLSGLIGHLYLCPRDGSPSPRPQWFDGCGSGASASRLKTDRPRARP